ncbi:MULTISPECIES: hypothetical protein [unclassified Streptomyces]|uniref:hypothetical protein n=1 Tax=unclassified Streptomyces TaxID=2593676 RepID=UPI0033C5EE35
MRARIKLVVAAVAVVSAGAAFAGVAIAADPTATVKAPYAQAAVSVLKDGTVAQKTNTMASVRKVSTGRYCVVLEPEVEVAKSVPVATVGNGSFATILVVQNNTACGNNSLYVLTAINGSGADQPFYLVVP